MSKKLEPHAVRQRVGSRYPAPDDAPCTGRWLLGDAAGLTQLGIDCTHLRNGCGSSQRHWKLSTKQCDDRPDDTGTSRVEFLLGAIQDGGADT